MDSRRGVRPAYDAIAWRYEEAIAEDSWMRRQLWRHYMRAFSPGDRVLDVGCGTGIDARFLAARGVKVVAVDVSAGMVAGLAGKARGATGNGDILASVQDVDRLAFVERPLFDGALSAFAGLNTVGDLSAFAGALAKLLEPGGRFVAHVLAPKGIWARGSHKRDGATRIVLVGGMPVTITVASAEETYETHFAAHFRLRRLYALGFLWPQSWNPRVPRPLAGLLGRLETRLGALPPMRAWGRFFVLDLEKR